jgi:polyadenylate-binding protein
MALATPYASASLYVGDIVNDVTEALLFEIFNAVGPVASVRVCRDAATRRSLGYAYVNFHRVEDAERALDTMNFKNIRNKPCRIMWSHRDPSLRKSGLGNIFVKNLNSSIDNKSLYDTFSMFGNILSCKVSTNPKRESLGYGFVHYESDEAAQTAIQRVNGKVIAGQKVIVAPFRSKKERGGTGAATGVYTNVYVKNMPDNVSQKDVEDLFNKHGKITSLMIATGPEGKPRGFGFINYDTPEEANAAVDALNGFEWNEKKLFVSRAQKRDEREKELRERFEQLKVERQKKYDGVNLYVKNLSDDITDERLREEFKQFGAITSTKIMIDTAGKSRGFGFVCFASPEEATKAVTEMNGRMLDSKPLYVSLAQRKEVRRAQLEAQHSQRAKMGVPPPQMYPPQGGPMFYAPGIPPRNFMGYPQQMMPRRWTPGQPGNPAAPPPQMLGVPAGRHPSGVNYQLMPIPNGRGPPTPGGTGNQRGGGAAGGRGGRRGQQQGNGMMQGKQMNGQQVMNAGRGQMRQGQYQQGRNQPEQPESSAVVPATGVAVDSEPLTIKALAAAPEEQKKQMIGERLFPLVKNSQPSRAGKITGMLLEMDNGELIHLLESRQALDEKINEAMTVLDAAGEGE